MFLCFLGAGGVLTVYLLLLAEGVKYDIKNSDLVPTSSLYIETIPKNANAMIDGAGPTTSALKKLTTGTHSLTWSYNGALDRTATIKVTAPQSFVLPPLRLIPAKPTLRALTDSADLICEGSKNLLLWTNQQKPNELLLSLINSGNQSGALVYKAAGAITACQISPDEKLAALRVFGSWLIINVPDGTATTRLTATFASWLNEKYYWDKNKKLYLYNETKPTAVAIALATKVVASGEKLFTFIMNPTLKTYVLNKKNKATDAWVEIAPLPLDIKITDYKFIDAYLVVYATKNNQPWLYFVNPDSGVVKYSYIGNDIFWHQGYRRWFIRFGSALQQVENLGDKPNASTILPAPANPTPDERASLVYYLQDNKIMAQETNGLWEDKITVATFPDKIAHFWLGPEQQMIIWLNDSVAERLISLDLLP